MEKLLNDKDSKIHSASRKRLEILDKSELSLLSDALIYDCLENYQLDITSTVETFLRSKIIPKVHEMDQNFEINTLSLIECKKNVENIEIFLNSTDLKKFRKN